MVTITELLTEVFNRVKSEHGVVLTRVDFSPASGAVGVAFRGVGCSKPAVYNGPLPPDPIPWPHPLRAATHSGDLGGLQDQLWLYNDNSLYYHSGSGWVKYVSLKPLSELLAQLTPLNPSSQSVTDSGS